MSGYSKARKQHFENVIRCDAWRSTREEVVQSRSADPLPCMRDVAKLLRNMLLRLCVMRQDNGLNALQHHGQYFLSLSAWTIRTCRHTVGQAFEAVHRTTIVSDLAWYLL